MKIENILLTTDFSENARKAYHRACSLAQKFGATIHLVHFAGMVPVTCGGAPSDDFYANTEQELEQEATTHPLLRQQRVSPALIQGRWTPNDLHGLEAERDIDIVVMATHGRTGLKHFVLGSFAERMVRNSMSPMLVCHERQVNDDFHPIRVLVPYDFSPPSSAVLPAIRFLAQNYGCSFHFVHIDEPLPARSRTLSVAVREMLVDAPLPSPIEHTCDHSRGRSDGGL